MICQSSREGWGSEGHTNSYVPYVYRSRDTESRFPTFQVPIYGYLTRIGSTVEDDIERPRTSTFWRFNSEQAEFLLKCSTGSELEELLLWVDIECPSHIGHRNFSWQRAGSVLVAVAQGDDVVRSKDLEKIIPLILAPVGSLTIISFTYVFVE